MVTFNLILLLSTLTTPTLASSPHLLRAEDVLIRPYISLPHLTSRDSPLSNTTNNAIQTNNTNTAQNLAQWDTTTNAACLSRLTALRQSSNPSGTCICYNLPALDSATGMFEADLRLFKVSASRGAWAGIAPGDIMVGLRYNGATVSEVKPGEMVRNASESSTGEDGVQLLQTYMFVGQIDDAKMGEDMTMAALEALVMPILTLTAKNTTGGTLLTNVSTNEAAFLTGVFSNNNIMSDFSAAQAAVDEQLAGLKNGTVAFVLPGVQLMIFPVGLIIVSVWLAVGVVVYGFGTYERMMYAEMYRRRQAVTVRRGKTF